MYKREQVRITLSIMSGRRTVESLTPSEKELLENYIFRSYTERNSSSQEEKDFYLEICEDILFDILSEVNHLLKEHY